jgi:hypothetical protein
VLGELSLVTSLELSVLSKRGKGVGGWGAHGSFWIPDSVVWKRACSPCVGAVSSYWPRLAMHAGGWIRRRRADHGRVEKG